MKKILIAILVLAMTFALAACGGKPQSPPNNGETAAPGSNSGAENSGNSVASDKIGFKKDGEYVVFKVNGGFKLTDSAWLGIVPAGVEYKSEAEADEVDIHYEYPWEFENMKAGDDYLFKISTYSIESIEDGNYIMVLCDNDDESVGAIVLQFPIVIKGSEITADFSKLKIN